MSAIDSTLTPGPGPALDIGRHRPAPRAGTQGLLLAAVGLAAAVMAGMLLCLASERTNVLLPQPLQPVFASGLAGPLLHLGIHLRSGEVLGALSAMFIGYVLTVRRAAELPLRVLILGIAALLVVVLIAPPLFSTDVFSYQAYAREFFGLHVNPYTSSPEVLGSGYALWPYIGDKWINTPSVYGPLFTLISGAFSDSSNIGAIALGVWAFKSIAALSCGGILWLVWKSAQLRGIDPRPGMALVGLNPLVVLYGVGGGHNDLLMMLFATAGIWALLARRERSSGAMTILAAAIKLTGGVFLPFAIAARAGEGEPLRRRRVAVGAGIATAVVLGVGIIVFGTRLEHMFVTLSQVQNESGWQSVPGFLYTAVHAQRAAHLITTIFGVAFVLLCGVLVWRVFVGRLDWIEGAGWATFALLVATSSILPWYVTWLLVPVALCRQRRLWTAALWFSGWVQLTTMIGYLPHPPTILGFPLN